VKQYRNHSNLTACLLIPNIERHPDKTAYFCNDEAVTYRQLADGVYRFASMLRDKGISRGDRVLIALPDSPVFVAAFLGTTLIGAVAVAVSTSLSGELYDYILNDCDAGLMLISPSVANVTGFPVAKSSCMVCGEQLSDQLAEFAATPVQPVEMQPDDLAYMLYTSGSTGAPKGVPHRHADLLEAARCYAVQVVGMWEDDIVFSASKLYFAYGLGNSMAFPLYVGATALLHPGIPLPDQLLSLIERRKPSLFFSVPTVYAQIIRSVSADMLSLPMRLCVSAGEALPEAVFQEWQRLTGVELLDGLGSTETTHIVISNRPGRALAGSAGQPVPGYEIRLVDDTGAIISSGTAGHLLIRGPGVAPYYWNQPEKTAATILPDGFIRTGDIFLEQEGSYYQKGRGDDMMKAGGQWISPVQIEEALRAHPAVADCAVAACRVGGLERPAAHVILQPGASPGISLEKELRGFMAARLPGYMCPLLYRFVDDLPRTATGKVQRFKLKQ
jgi:benzoate-CoA ligase